MLAACTHAQVQTVESYQGPPLSRPDHIFVAHFSIAPKQVRLDQGVGTRIMRAADAEPLGAQELQAARATQAALAQALVGRLKRYGLPGEIATNNTGMGPGLLVQGQIVSIDQGNRTRRVLIGLGAGKSSISADTQLYKLSETEPPRFIMAFKSQADSGRMPGAAETMGADAAAQRVGTAATLTGATHAEAETRRTTDTAKADQLANAIARRISRFAVAQGWIPRTALH
ncbi:MAG: DUF4410 domain-containing protein [Rhodopila sp.]|nr:DUF4410 domain-containing protein [Rhodopila sp.]